ncbi:MAG: hypothetical protein QNJ33_11365 [Crocosphaera sp.]|nr:hypothetical protein [Crocosphaera sp.]
MYPSKMRVKDTQKAGTRLAWEIRKKLNKPDKVPRDSGKRKRLISRSVREPTVGDVLIVRTNVF